MWDVLFLRRRATSLGVCPATSEDQIKAAQMTYPYPIASKYLSAGRILCEQAAVAQEVN